jgi:hypothetical protein
MENIFDGNKLPKKTRKQIKEFELYLNEYAQVWLEDNFKMGLDIPINISGRLNRGNHLGRFSHYTNGGAAVAITLSERFVQLAMLDGQRGRDNVLDVLHHELTHYALYELGVTGYVDHEANFESTIQHLSVGGTNLINYTLKYQDSTSEQWYKWNEWDKDKQRVLVTYKSMKEEG